MGLIELIKKDIERQRIKDAEATLGRYMQRRLFEGADAMPTVNDLLAYDTYYGTPWPKRTVTGNETGYLGSAGGDYREMPYSMNVERNVLDMDRGPSLAAIAQAKAAIEGGAEAKRALAKADMLGDFPVQQAELQGRASAARRMGEVEGLVPRLSDYGFEPMDILAPSFGTPFSENLRRRRILAEETGKNEAQRGISKYTTLADYINPLPEDARFDTMENLGMKVPYKERARRAEDLARKTRVIQQAERIPPYVQTALKVIATFAKKTAPRSGLDMLIMSNPKAIEDPRIQRLFGGTTLAPEDKIALDRARTIVMGYLGSHQKTPSVDEFKKKYGLD